MAVGEDADCTRRRRCLQHVFDGEVSLLRGHVSLTRTTPKTHHTQGMQQHCAQCIKGSCENVNKASSFI